MLMYIGIWCYGQLSVCQYGYWYLLVWTVVCMLISTLASDGMDGCMYVNMYIGTLVVWTVVRLLTCTLVSGGMDDCMYVGIWWYGRLYVC